MFVISGSVIGVADCSVLVGSDVFSDALNGLFDSIFRFKQSC